MNSIRQKKQLANSRDFISDDDKGAAKSSDEPAHPGSLKVWK